MLNQLKAIADDASSIAVVAAVATLVAGIITAFGTAFAPPIALLFRRFIDRRRSRVILTDEVVDLLRHCKANLEILESILARPGIPARMHIEKMRMFKTMLIFDNTIVFDIPSNIRRRLIQLRLVIRNLDYDIDDTITFIYHQPPPNLYQIRDQLSYLREKFIYAVMRLEQELHSLNKKRGSLPQPVRPQRIIYRSHMFKD